ncbi:sensor histidine kinase [Oceanicella actignis]|uniref:sensor histidine kinase n=1 Tax=Oceanicella actignis TaxID=1189325 RepID=UPI0011E852FB|nr:HAMP domain-containing sensor histidine kinase [Oceanicella actignis]TYO84715.1 signal transduction histidine kinase [Oceanicella actignis]
MLAALVAGTIAWALMRGELEDRLGQDARAQAEALAQELASSGRDELIREIGIESAFGDGHDTLFAFVPAEGGPSAGNMTLPQPFEGPRRLVAGRDMTLRPDPGAEEGEVYYAWGVRTGQGWIVVARDSQWIADSEEVLIKSIAWGLGAAVLATLLLAVAAARRDARRVAEINRLLARVAAGDLAARGHEEAGPRDDLAQVIAGINAMLERLEANVERLAQVSADIAHDLRSPLTRLRLRLEPQALRQDLPEDTRAAIVASLESLDGIAAGFDAILQLSQIETGNMALEARPTDLRQIAQDVHEMLLPVAEESGHALTLSLPPDPVIAEVNPELVSQALVNLVENALRHTPPGARIAISARAEGKGVRLSVCDDGPGIPAEERDKVTRRFYRLDRSRSRPGTGLGLSLVAAIARLHGGRLELSDNAPGLCAALVLGPPGRLS